MSDIVERLRGIAEDAEPDDAGWCAIMREAADAIERLRGEVSGYREHISHLADVKMYDRNLMKVLSVEVERLRNTIKNCPPVSESEYVRRLEDEVERK